MIRSFKQIDPGYGMLINKVCNRWRKHCC